MTREQAKKLSPAIQHFANGGKLWAYGDDKKWYIQTSIYPQEYSKYVIEDKHFEARKAHALGGEIEYLAIGNNGNWYPCGGTMQWIDDLEYRPKSTEPVYEWPWAYIEYEDYVMSEYHTEEETSEDHDWIKFEPSKRIRK